jgi:hypothetical protein
LKVSVATASPATAAAERNQPERRAGSMPATRVTGQQQADGEAEPVLAIKAQERQ